MVARSSGHRSKLFLIAFTASVVLVRGRPPCQFVELFGFDKVTRFLILW
jgi:hypothetical protein